MQTFLSGGKTIHIDHLEPPGPGPFPAILLVHGAGGNTTFWFDRIAHHLARLRLALYAVHYFDRTGTQRADDATITDGHHFPLWLDTLSGALSHIAARPAIDSRRIALLGISLGAFLSLALATRNPNLDPRIRAIVEISGGLPEPYRPFATSGFPPTLILHGEADTVVPVSHAHALNATLNTLQTPHRMNLFPNEGHWFSTPAQARLLTAIALFLAQHL